MNRPEPQADVQFDTPLPAIRGDSAEAIRAFLASHDANCRMCGYCLRGLAGPCCPECGAAIQWANVRCENPMALGQWHVVALVSTLPASMILCFGACLFRIAAEYNSSPKSSVGSVIDNDLANLVGGIVLLVSVGVTMLVGLPLTFATWVSRVWKSPTGFVMHCVFVALSLAASAGLLRVACWFILG